PSFRVRRAGGFFRWLSRIAEHRLYDVAKARKARKRGGGKTALEPEEYPEDESVVKLLDTLAVDDKTPSQTAERHEAIAYLLDAIDNLKDDYRDAIRLHFLLDVPVADVAMWMQRSEEAVWALCHRGIRHLRQALGRASRFLSRHG